MARVDWAAEVKGVGVELARAVEERGAVVRAWGGV